MSHPTRNKILWGSLSAFCVLVAAGVLILPPLWADPARESPAGSVRNRNNAQVLQSFMDYVSSRYVDDVDSQKLFEGALKGMLESLEDPYTHYLTEKEFQSLSDTTTGEFGGVGLFINKTPPGKEPAQDPADKYVVVVRPIQNTPGQQAGIMSGDIITKIDGESTEALDVEGAQKRIRGPAGSSVTLTILRGESWEFPVTLKRAVIEVPTVYTTLLGGDKYGYIQIISFTDHTPARVEEALKDYASRNVKGVILDVRSNPGGLLTSVIRILDGFFDDGVLVSTKGRTPGDNQSVNAQPGKILPVNIPVTVLINKESASASEILAGGLKDRGRAFLLGETTFGKGSVQQVLPFASTGFKITTARYYTPSDVSPDKIGVSPHKEFVVPAMTEKEIEGFRKLTQEKKIETFARGQARAEGPAVEAYARELSAQGYALDQRILRRLISDEIRKQKNIQPPVADLDFDLMLIEALRLMDAGLAKP